VLVVNKRKEITKQGLGNQSKKISINQRKSELKNGGEK
jgi:hypothetical protein